MIARYLDARDAVVAAGYEEEIAWQASRNLDRVSEAELLGEAAWVILNSGFRESTARKVWPGISAAFLDWKSASLIVQTRQECIDVALTVFGHQAKIEAMAWVAGHVAEFGLAKVKSRIATEGVAYLRTWPYIGKVTCYHLAKNLGLDVAKPDRHLVRIAGLEGVTVDELCARISKETGDPVPVVDIVLWRFSALGNTWSEL